MTVVVGCDLGTTGTKAAVVRLDGVILGSASEEIALHTPAPGRAEQDLLDIEVSAHRTIRRAVEESGVADEVVAIAVSGQMSGIGMIDRHFQPVAPYDSWLDTRCAPVIEELGHHADRIMEVSGCPPTYSHGPKIRWWNRHHPATASEIHRWVTASAFVSGRLAGLAADDAYIDRTHLHFSNLADNAAATWSEELCELLEVDPRVLPRIVQPTDVVGTLTREAAEATGLPDGTPVAAGAGDTSAAALGAGVVRPGVAFDLAGTASVFAVCVDRFAPDLAQHTMMATAGIVPDTWVALAFINGGGLALRWFRDELSQDLDGDIYGRLGEMAAEVPPGAGGLLWHPHVQGRVLPPRPDERSAWVGLTSGHRRGHLFRAMLEGIAFEYARWAQAALAGAGVSQLREARAVGGGAASPLWNQIKADVLGIDWLRLERQEAGVLGNALVAGAAAGQLDDLASTAEAWQQVRETSHPDPERHRRYERVQTASDRLAQYLPEVFGELAAAVGHEDVVVDEAAGPGTGRDTSEVEDPRRLR